MMDFISIPIVVGMVTLGIYKMFELFVRRKERLQIIEKLGDKLDPGDMLQNQVAPLKIFSNFSTGALKAGCLLVGIGLGLLVGFFIIRAMYPNLPMAMGFNRETREIASVVFGSSVLLFGGLSLLVAFFIEMRLTKDQKK